jgi:hypothetical protein
MDAPAFDARFVRPALRSIAFCFSVVLISTMTMVKPAHASGTVASINTYFAASSGFGNYVNAATPAEACDHFAKSPQVTGPVVTQISSSQWQCTYTYVNTGTSWDGTNFLMWVFYVSPACPANSSGTVTCTCNINYTPDPTGTSCVPVSTCPVKPLTTPPFSDACSTSLERGHGVDVNNKCGTLREPDMAAAASCIADKIHKALGYNVYTVPSSTIRTVAYQDHLLEIWTKSQRLDTIMNSVVFLPEIKQACVPVNVDVGNEKVQHGITHQPSSSGDAAPHVQHRAIDVPEAVANALMDQVTTYTTTTNSTGDVTTTITGDVEDYMHSATDNPPACDPNLSWGGRFKKPKRDPVHFQLP